MATQFYTNFSEVKFIDRLKSNLDACQAFYFSVSFIKKPGLDLLANNIEAALKRGAKGQIITSTYQNFTDIKTLLYLLDLQVRYPDNFECRLDKECFKDYNENVVGFHTKGYLFEFSDNDKNELLIGSSNITIFALLKNVEWDVSIVGDNQNATFFDAKAEFEKLWEQTLPLSKELIEAYRSRIYYSIERWDMDYCVANSELKPNYMQKRALNELNRIRKMGATKALVISASGSGKTFLAAFDAQNFSAKRLLYVVHEGSILTKSFDTFQQVFGNERTYGRFDGDYKEIDSDFIFATNVTMAKNRELFDKHAFDYIIIDECHHAAAETYEKIISYFEPEFLLGITATPERMDGEDIYSKFDQNVPFELRLRDAIVNDLVVPFKYFGIRDEQIEYANNSENGHKFIEQLSDEGHCGFVHDEIEKHRDKGKKLKAIAFCKNKNHARRMAEAMEQYYHTLYLTGDNSIGERIKAYNDLQSDSAELELLFTVDILNEGVDIPGVNMVVFLRPTDSQTVFIQQLGRGLRKYENKTHVNVLDFIGNDYKRSVQIAFALGSLSKNFVLEKHLVKELIKDNYKSLGLEKYGVEINIDELSQKEILGYIDSTNFNNKSYLKQDYYNFKKFINSQYYPKHVDYLNNDCAPDLIKFMKISLDHNKTNSYIGFLEAIGENGIPSFDENQRAFIDYVSEMLPIVRPYEYLIIQKLLCLKGRVPFSDLLIHLKGNIDNFNKDVFDHAIRFMIESGYFIKDNDSICFNNFILNKDLEDYLEDLLKYGLGKYAIDFDGLQPNEVFKLWAKYRNDQVQQLILNTPKTYQRGTVYKDDNVYVYVTVIKDHSIKDHLKYDDGYIDESTFQWETVANIKPEELERLKNSKQTYVFVRKFDREDNITLPFTYIGSGKMGFVENSRKENGAYLFHIPMNRKDNGEIDITTPEDIFFDFKLPS